MTPKTSSHPQLAPPGAGLPKIERFLGNLGIRWKAMRTTRERVASDFSAEHQSILQLLAGCDEAVLARRVLIKRIAGLEDSSRYWSPLMAADHLRIVNREIGATIVSLVAGQIPPRTASTAAVKPTAEVTPAVINDFDQGCRDFSATVARQADLKTALKFVHPWFGPMDASLWHFMSATHMRLHRKQIELILAGSPNP